jgi:DNA-binding winged helix-turn-helix (wHTH) protein/predicted ATPase
VIRFGEFALDPQAMQLRRAGEVIELQPRTFELLHLLVSTPGKMFSREEIEAALWPDVKVTEDSLTQAVRRVRVALGDETRSPRFVETVPRRGYRWIAPLVSEDRVRPAALPVLPRPDDGFFGRQAELAQLQALLLRARLVTVTGPGGVGKSRLAMQLPEVGVCCRLGAVTDRAGLDAAVLAGMGLPPQAPLRDVLATCTELVLLDEAEAIVELLAPALVEWLDSGSSVRFLVTSRVRLGLAAEHVLELAPLPLDEGVALYEQRKSAVEPQAQDDEADVRALVETLDGFPLALELAAARRSVVGARGLLQRLPGALVRRGGHDRHRSMGEALAFSWSLLSDLEKIALCRLSCFVGGMALEPAERVLEDLPDALGLLEALRHHSWLVRAGDRLDQYALLRAFASERRDELGLRQDAERRHAHAMAERAMQHIQGPTAPLVPDRADLWAAFHACDDPELLVWLWQAVGRLSAACESDWTALDAATERVLALSAGRPQLQARVLSHHSLLWQGRDKALALSYARRALELAEPWPAERVRALDAWAMAHPLGDPAREAAVAEALHLLESLEEPTLRARMLWTAGLIELQCGRPVRSLEVLSRAVQLHQELGLELAESESLLHLGKVALLVQELALAHRSLLRGLGMMDPRYDAVKYAQGLMELALLARYEDRAEDALTLLLQAEELGRRAWLLVPIQPICQRAELLVEAGDLQGARALLAPLPDWRQEGRGRAEISFCALLLLLAEARWEEAEENLDWRVSFFRRTRSCTGEARACAWHALVAAARGDEPGARRHADLALGLVEPSMGRAVAGYVPLAELAPPLAAFVSGEPSAREAVAGGLAAIWASAAPGPTTHQPALEPDLRAAVRVIERLLATPISLRA